MSLSPRRTVAVEDVISLEAIRNVELACGGSMFIDHQGKVVYDSRYKRAVQVTSHHYAGTAGDAPRRTSDITDIISLEAVRNVEMAARGRIFVDEEGNLNYDSRHKRRL